MMSVLTLCKEPSRECIHCHHETPISSAPSFLTPYQVPLALPKLTLWHIPQKKKAKRTGSFLMSPGKIVYFDDDTNDIQQANVSIKGRPVYWILKAPPHWRGVIMVLIKTNVSWRVARHFSMSRHKGPCIKCSSVWRISEVMRDILANTLLSLVIIDKIRTTRKKSYKNNWHGFRIIMCLIDKVCHMQSSQSLTHTETHSSAQAFHDISPWHICLWNSGWHVCCWPVAISNTTTVVGLDKKKGTDLAGANTFAKCIRPKVNWLKCKSL